MGGGTNGNANQGCAVAHQEGAFALEKGALGRKEGIRTRKENHITCSERGTARNQQAEDRSDHSAEIRSVREMGRADRRLHQRGRPAVRAFFAALNRAFKAYGLNLKPGDLADVESVEDLVTVVAGWFTRHGYQVTE